MTQIRFRYLGGNVRTQGQIEVQVDTTGTTPSISVGAAAPGEAVCLRRESQARFRSVGPARVVFAAALR